MSATGVDLNSCATVAGLHSGFVRSADEFPERPALEVGGTAFTYAELRERAAALAATLVREDAGGPLTAVFAYRTATAFAGVLGALFAGHAYVPLSRALPTERSRLMLAQAGCRALIVDAESAAQLEEILAGETEPRVVILPDLDDVSAVAARLPGHRVLGRGDLAPAEDWEPPSIDPEALAYLLFTSGSTGLPKGVMIAHRSVTHWVESMVERYGVTEHDRFSNTNELTFDASVFDLWVPWARGACVCCPSRKTLIKPDRYIHDAQLSIWYSVPSTAIFLRRLGALKPDAYPALRWSLFVGEPLPVDAARAWAEAAPDSTLENLYGPTEATVHCTVYRWDPERSPAECERGIVPIGAPLPGMSTLVVDEDLNQVEPGAEGELLVSGPQVALGYWKDPEKTGRAFVVPSGRDTIHYRTGDRVRRPVDESPMTYLGRVDHQIQVFGERIELGEIEAALREESGVEAVVALGWPVTPTGASGIVAFIGDEGVDVAALNARLRARLPGHMVPRQLHVLPDLPLNPNGKFDRRALLETLEEERR